MYFSTRLVFYWEGSRMYRGESHIGTLHWPAWNSLPMAPVATVCLLSAERDKAFRRIGLLSVQRDEELWSFCICYCFGCKVEFFYLLKKYLRQGFSDSHMPNSQPIYYINFFLFFVHVFTLLNVSVLCIVTFYRSNMFPEKLEFWYCFHLFPQDNPHLEDDFLSFSPILYSGITSEIPVEIDIPFYNCT